MATFLCGARRAILGISLKETAVQRRGFRATGAAAERLERIGREFLGGYHAALEEISGEAVAVRLNLTVDDEFRGFAFEGAAMGFTLLDQLRLTRGGFADFLAGSGAEQRYMLHVGAGWAFARLPWLRQDLGRTLSKMDPLLGWLAADGYGFHEGYFHWPESIDRQLVPAGVQGYARRAFDQGLGRSLWFVEGIHPERAGGRIRAFAASRQPDLWAGTGLAAAYAGGAAPDALVRLKQLAGESAAALAQGAAFAAEARRRAGNLTPHTEEACQVLCGMPALDAADISMDEMRLLPPDGAEPAYEVWRVRVQQRLAQTQANRTTA